MARWVMSDVVLKKGGLDEDKKKTMLLRLKSKCDKLMAVPKDLYQCARKAGRGDDALAKLTHICDALTRLHSQATRPAPQKRPRKRSIYNLSKQLLCSVHAIQNRFREDSAELTEYDADDEDGTCTGTRGGAGGKDRAQSIIFGGEISPLPALPLQAAVLRRSASFNSPLFGSDRSAELTTHT